MITMGWKILGFLALALAVGVFGDEENSVLAEDPVVPVIGDEENSDLPKAPVVPEPREPEPETLQEISGEEVGNSTVPVVPEPRYGYERVTPYTFNNAGQSAFVVSPSYPFRNYSNNMNEKVIFTSPPGTVMELDCQDFNMEYSADCSKDAFTFALNGDQSLQRESSTIICGQGTFKRTTTTNSLIIRITSDGWNVPSSKTYRYKCKVTALDGSSNLPPANNQPQCACGERNEAKRIVGGVDASVNEFPWRCNLYSPYMGVFCGATLISENWALTAAHCTAAVRKNNIDKIYLNCAEHDISTQSDSVNVVTEVAQMVDHPSYSTVNQDNDISLLRLASPLQFGRTIQPICLPWKLTGNSFSGMSVMASGWGTTTYKGTQSKVLRKVELPTLSTQECRRYYGQAVTDNMMCTYSPGRDTCQGDSGGGIDYKDPDTGRYMTIGVVSWGVKCAGINEPGVYAKVTNYLNWIQSTTYGANFCRI